MYATQPPMAGLQVLTPAMIEDPEEAFAVAVWLIADLALACTRETDSEDRRLVLRAADELCRGWDLDG